MVRRSMADGEKRKQIAVRLSPEDLVRVGQVASEDGISVGAEIEKLALAQAAYVEASDEPTRDLLAAILNEIAEIQAKTGKKWFRDRATWSAVAAMLEGGPIRDRETDSPFADEFVQAAFEKARLIQEEKRRISDRLRGLGISVTPEHPLRTAPRRQGLGLFGSVSQDWTIRTTERAAIEALPASRTKDEAEELFVQLVELDDAEQDANEECDAQTRPYWDAKADGREVYLRMLKSRAEQNRNEGRPFNYLHLMGIFQ